MGQRETFWSRDPCVQRAAKHACNDDISPSSRNHTGTRKMRNMYANAIFCKTREIPIILNRMKNYQMWTLPRTDRVPRPTTATFFNKAKRGKFYSNRPSYRKNQDGLFETKGEDMQATGKRLLRQACTAEYVNARENMHSAKLHRK